MTNINRRRFPILLASALALLAILGALLLPITAQAQTATVLVSNIEQTTNAFALLDVLDGDQALSITTGGTTSDSHTIESLEIKVDEYERVGSTGTVSLYSDNSGVPGSSIFTFTNPTGGIVSESVNTFTAPDNTTLTGGTTYHIVVSGEAPAGATGPNFDLEVTTLNDQDDAGEDDWEIGDSGHSLSGTTWSSSTYVMQIRVNGSAVGGETPTLSTDATLSGLSLGTGVTLSPAFASGTDTYTASVANSVDEVTVTTTTNHASATVEILDTDNLALTDADSTEDGFQVALSVGTTQLGVLVTAEDGTTTKFYTVNVTRDDCPSNNTTTCEVDVGGSVTGTIGTGTDRDWFKVVLEAGTRYQIDLEGADTGRGTLPDPRMGLYDGSNTLVGSLSSDEGVGKNARRIYTPTAAGDYYVRAQSSNGLDTGTYTLSVIVLGANGASEADTDFPTTTATTGRVDVGASVTGNIGIAIDYDWFRVDLEAGKTYQIDLKGIGGGGGTLADPYLLNIRDSSGTEIDGTENDDIDPSNDIYDSQTVYTPTAAGTYYLVAVSGVAGWTGTYTLSVRDITPPSCTLNTGDLWCGVVTVGEYKSGEITFAYGFVDATTDTGALSDTTFDVSPNSYTIDRASVGVSGLAGQLIFSLTSALTEPDRAKLVLHVDGSSGSFAFDGVTPTASFGYRWAMSGLDWSSETSVTLRLRDTPVPSTDATLSGLSLGTGVTLSPAFASGTATYTASVANSVDEVTVTPTTNHASATVEILDTDDNELDDADDVDDDFQVALSVGDTVIKVKVTAEDGTSTQTYTVTVTRAAEMTPDDPPDDSGNVSEGDTDLPGDTTTTGKVEVGGSVTGKIRNLNDKDWFAVELEAGKRYQIDMEGADTGRGTLTHPRVSGIYDAAANAIANTANNGGGVGNNARVIYTPDAAGTYYVEAYFQTGELNRTYTLSVILLGANGASEADTDFPNNDTTSGRVEVGASVTGNTATVSGDDWFRVDLEVGKTYQFDLEGVPTNRGTLPDPLLTFYDGSGNQISRNDDIDPANNLNSQIVYPATATDTYYLSANSTNLKTGTYTLSVRDITPATCTLNTGDVWCGVVTVGMFTLDGTSYLGYLDGTGGGGMLSDNDFDFTDTELDSKSHTITGVLLDSGTLSLVFEDSQDEDDKPVLDTWDLQVGTDTFALDDDDVTQLPTGGYQWTGTGLSWSVGDTVTLRLRGETGPPSVANVAVTSMPLLTSLGGSEQDTYGAGDEIEFTVTFSQVVVVTGDPQFGFSLSGARQADYRSGSGSTALKFVYTVQSSDSDDDGIWIGNHNSTTKSLQLDANDEITSPGGIDANLEHDQKQVQAGHKVDGSRSLKPTLSIADAAAAEGADLSFTVTLSAAAAATVTATWTASIETGDTAVAADLGATKMGTVTVTAGQLTGTFTVSTVEDTAVEANETFTVTLSSPSSNAKLETDPTAQGTINNDDLATLSTDATLSGLSLGTGVTLSPAFASGTVTYTASVANSVDKVTVTPTTNHASATVEILDKDDLALTDADSTEDGFQVALSVGSTQFGVLVTAEDGTTTKFYTVNVTRDDFPADTTTTGKVDVGGSVTGNITSASDRDWFRVDLKKDKRYQIDLEGAGTNRGTLTDPTLNAMRDASSNSISGTGNSDSGVGINARTIFTALADGAHYVVAAGNGATGTYTLSVIVLGANGASEADFDFPATTATSGRVEVGASATGNIKNLDDAYDWFRVDLEAGKTYQYDLEGVDTSRGMLDDPYLGLFDGSGTSLFDDDDDGTGLNSRITHTPATGGTYYLGAARAGTSAGTYTLSVRDITLPTLSVADASDAENDGEVEFTVTLSEAAATAVTATWTASIETGDTAVAADLGTTTTGTVTVAIGDTTGTFEVPVVNDATDEGDETFTVTLSSVSSNAQLETDPTAKGTIEDDDATADDCPNDTTTTCEVDVGGSATGNIETGTDRDWFKVVLEAGTRYQIDLEGEPTGRGTLANPKIRTIINAEGNSITGVNDNDGGVGNNARVIYSPTADGTYYAQVVDSTGTATGTYTLSVIVLGANGVSEADTDFPNNALTSGRVDVGASATGNVESATDVDRFRVDLEAGKQYQFDLEGAPTDRGTLEDPYLSLIDPMGTVLESDNDDGDGVNSQIVYTATATGAHYLRADKSDTETGTYTLSVRDITLPTLSVADASDAENDGEVEFTVTLSEAAATAVTATWTASIETGDTAVAADLGTTTTGTVTVAIGDTMGTFEVPVVNDSTDEGDETFTVTLSGVSSNAKLETDPTAKGTIEDDDATLPTLSIADAAATEGSPVSFTVTLSAAAAADVTATWTASIETVDTAVAADLGTTTTGTVTVAIGDTMGTFTVATVEDTTVEVNETFTVTLSSPSSNAQLSSTAATAQGTINNDDLATVSVGDAEGDEDDGVEFTLTLSAAAPADVTVDWTASIESGDSASTADLATTKTGTVTITKGATTKRFTAPVNDDSTDEPDQTFTVTLSNPTPPALVELAADPTAEGTIEDDDDPPTISVVDMTVIEGDLNPDNVPTFNNNPGFPWTVTLSEASEKRVRYRSRQVVDGTATDADLKVTVAFSGRPSIQAGLTSVVRGVNNIVNDALDEDDETFTIEVYDLENATAGAKTRSTITIEDDDPTPTVTVADAAATEGDKVEFVVTLSAVSGRDVDVDYATSVATGDGAVSGTDFTAASGTLTIAAADSTATGTIEVQTTEDDTSESAETFTLTISSPDNATLTTDTTATGTINNRATTAAEPTTFAAAVGDEEVVLSWDAPDSASGVTRHEYQYKEGTGAYQGWEQIANSGVDGANEAGFTVTGLTNEVLHTFQLRAVNAQGESTAAEADPVTPTPGICGRTQQVRDALLELTGVEDCKAVTVADLAGVTFLNISLQALGVSDITALKSGDFGGLTGLTNLTVADQQGLTTLPSDIFSGLSKLTTLALVSNQLNSLSSNVFSDLTKLTALNLRQNELTSLPSNVFSDLTKLEILTLGENELTSPLPAGLFDGLTALEKLFLDNNELSSLPAGLFDDPTALISLQLQLNKLSSLPPNVFSGLAALEILTLEGNDLSSLPDGLFSGLTGLTRLALDNNPNTDDVLALTVTVEKFGTDQARAKVPAGAPFAVDFTATVVNGSLPTGVTKLAVAAGSVDGTAVTVTRTTGTMAAVTVDIDLTTQPTLPTNHTGYEFVKATSGLPAEILPDTRGPQNFTAKPGDGQAVLAWTAPASGSGVTKHQYRQKEGTGSYPANWTDIPNSAEGGANEDGYTVTGLTNETVYTFELKRFVGTTESATAESNAVTPTPGICDRTQQVQDGILAAVSGVTECEAVTVANLAGIGGLSIENKGVTSLKAGDFAGLTGMTTLNLTDNSLSSLPAGVFSGLTALGTLELQENDLETLPAGLFSGLTALITLKLNDNDLSSLDAGVFSGLSALGTLELQENDLETLPAGLFSGLTALASLNLSDNTTNPMLLTVTVEKVGTDRVRAKVLAGAPFAVAIPVTPANGTLAGDVTVLTVAKGSVESAAVTVTRTEGTTDAVTVDVDLSTQPSRPAFHVGYIFARAASGLPAEILPEEASLEPPTGLSATPGDREAVLTWTPPAADSGFTRHQYRYRTGGSWTDIPDSGPGEANATRYTVTELDNAVEYSFELRARDAGAGKSDAATVRVTPTGPPRILSVEVTSGPGLDGDTYGEDEEIRIEVTFDQPVVVTGDPELDIEVGSASRHAHYDSGGGTEVLVFVYVVRAGDSDGDGIEIGDDALELNGGGIGNGAGDDAELPHDGPGQQSGHRVDGERRAGVHDHGEFTHSHSHFRQQYPEHTHEGHEHADDANGHKRRPGTHVHHAQEDPNASISGGPDVRTHDRVEHIHRCFDLKPSCNQGDDYAERGDELGLPIEVTHSHEHSEPGHRFHWRAFFEEGGSGATVSVADAVAVRGEGRTLDFEVSLEPAVAFAVRVEYETVDGTATAGEDYRETSGVLEIPPGQTRGTVSVRMPADGPGDGPELFKLRLGSATAAAVADDEATGTILTPGPSTPPVIERIAVVSTPRLISDGNRKDTYGEGETIRIEVRFDQPVVVVGDPTFALEVGDPCESVCEADYESGSGADTLVFAYLVLEVDVDRNGIAIRGNPIEVVLGDSIRNAAGQEARLTSKGKGTQRNHRVDGSQSAAAHLSVADAEAHEADGEMTFTVRLEPHGLGIVTVDYATRDGSARAGEDYTATGGTLRFNSLETERTVTVPITDDTVPDDGDTFTLTLSNPDGAKLRDGDGEATGTIHNSEPQEALTASFEDVPAAHDGAAFRFRVAFSEDIGISFQALREDAFAVTNGRITDGVPVDDRRDLFDMTLEPDGDGDVAVTLEADRDCAESGAICTKGEPRRRLTTTVSAMVAGPDGAANAPATGAPAITGRLRVGEILSALTSGIADEDGLEEAEFAHQWLRGDADIAGATGYRYTLADSDEGKAIRVRVTFTDDAGNEETLTSAPTELVLEEPVFGDGPPGAPRNLTVSAGDQEVTLSWEPPADNGNAPATRYRIEWRIDGKDYKKGHWGPSGETTYTKTDLANGVKYIFRVKAENGNGNSYGPYGPASEEVSATPTSGLAVDLGTPVLSNTKTLHHGMVKLDWEDVEDAGWYVVQYYHVKGGEWLDLPAAGVDIAFHGSSAVVSNLHGLSWLRVRAMSCAGESEWSQIEELYGTNASDWEGVPVPEVAEGDEIEPCPVVLGTPVLSNTETLHHGMVRLDWEDIEDAGWYVVQYYHAKGGEWLDLPAEGVDIAFHGSSAVVSNLHGLSWLRVRAMSCAGASEWSQIEELYGTNASDWEGVPVPEVAEGDEIEPCSEDADTSDNTPATGVPTISGTAQVGETLTANTSGVVDADGLKNATFSYQWLADNAAIAGATGSTYTLADSDEGKAITVQVSFTDDAGNNEALTSAATAAVAAAPTPNSPATGAPTISGTAQVGETLTADRSGIADADGLDDVSFTYQWLADDTEIAGATGSTYTVAAADEGKAIKVQVSFTDDAGNEETLTSEATDAVAAAPAANNPATGAPTISGTAQVGETLTADRSGIADADGLSNVQYEYQWLADDTAIQGATDATHTLANTDEGKAIKVQVSFTDDAGNNEALTSAATGAVSAAEPTEPPARPTGLSATASHDSVTLTWDDPGDDSITGYVILRRVRENNTGGDFSELVADTGTAATTYTDDTVAAGTTYTYRIKAINGAGTSERSRWFHIDTPAAPVPDKPTGLSATASHDSVTLTWEDPGDDSITGYVILRRLRYDDPSGHFDELVADTGTAATTYTDDTVKANTHYTYRIKAISGAGVSERSRWFHIHTQEAP